MAAVESSRSKAGTRGKFATPPVKLACLPCRTARVRCDGSSPCSVCSNKKRKCTYPQASRRGGPRVHGNKRPSARESVDSGSDVAEKPVNHSHHPQLVSDRPANGSDIGQETNFHQTIPSMINPGSGLTNLDDIYCDTDSLFNTVFSSSLTPDTTIQQSASPQGDQTHAYHNIVRKYRSDDDLLSGYYTWIHPFFPILPPPTSYPVTDNPIPWSPKRLDGDISPSSSPLSLALSTILSLIPFADQQPLHCDCAAFKRYHAQNLAMRALDSIETDSEIPDSASSPARALLHDQRIPPRERFHPKVPIELEAIIALCILSVYEYAQRGNLKKMRDRAGQALVAAMDLSLHCQAPTEDEFSEARRRTWWMCYICVCQAAIVSCTNPAMSAHDPRFTTPFPSLQADSEAWPLFIRSQQEILSATQFVRQLNETIETGTGAKHASETMIEFHGSIDEMIIKTEHWAQRPLPRKPIDSSESIVAEALMAMSKIKLNSARIKVHRYCAFSDIPVFSERHCDLEKAKPISAGVSDQGSTAMSSCCSTALPLFNSAALSSRGGASEHSTSSSSSYSGAMTAETPNIPFSFTSHESSRICMKSALNIAKAFESLPFPRPIPSRDHTPSPQFTCAPRTMPSFACCAMQSAYALLNLHHKAYVMIRTANNEHLISSLLDQCESGLQSVLAALDNYAMSFEAISGMRDQVRVAIDCLAVESW